MTSLIEVKLIPQLSIYTATSRGEVAISLDPFITISVFVGPTLSENKTISWSRSRRNGLGDGCLYPHMYVNVIMEISG